HPESMRNLRERTIHYLDQLDAKLDKKWPNLTIQNKFDHIYNYLQTKFAPLKEFNEWLDSNGHGKWYAQLSTFLAKLPLRAVRNIVRLLYAIIKGAAYSVVHPLKASIHVARLILLLLDELTKPETWSKMSVGILGASVGQTLITGNPLSLIGIGIGGAM